MSKYGLLIDYEYCSGCHSCEIACRNEKDIALDDWGIKLASIGPWKRENGTWEWNNIPVPTQICDLCASRVNAGKKTGVCSSLLGRLHGLWHCRRIKQKDG